MALLLSQIYNAAFFSAMVPLAQSFRNVRDCSFYAHTHPVDLNGFFNPNTVVWTIPADRMAPGVLYRREQPHLSVPFDIVNFNPATLSWIIGSYRPVSRRYWTAPWTSTEWAQFDPTLVSWIHNSQRVIPRPYWTPPWTGIDWNVPISAPTFDAALFPGIAELVGWTTPKPGSLVLPLGVFVYDLSWVHDVIPLTDAPPAPSIIKLRPIAPIMNRRRRRRR